MTKTVEFSGKTEDEAIELALEQLGLTRDDVSVEILERAKTGFLGLKNTPAIVRIQYETKEEITTPVETFLQGLFERMDIKVDLEITKADEDALNVILSSKEPGALIGRRGETLDAIQHLTNYVVNRGSSSRVRINMDAENYRQRRNETLEKVAIKTAERVTKTRRNMTLEPMNAYERHVIHSALQDNNAVNTYSVGSEPNRKVVIAYGRNNNSGSRNYSDSGRAKTYRGNAEQSGFSRDKAESTNEVNATEAVTPEQVTPETPETDTGQYREWS